MAKEASVEHIIRNQDGKIADRQTYPRNRDPRNIPGRLVNLSTIVANPLFKVPPRSRNCTVRRWRRSVERRFRRRS
jgi:hypothetical protein